MKWTAFILLAFASLCSNAASAQNNSDKRFATLDTAFRRVLTDWHAAGFAVAVVDRGKVIYARGFGYRDVAKKLPVTANTQFAIGSCTKAFTASLIGLLNKDDKVDLDKPVKTYLPTLRLYNDQLTDNVTLRDLMCHRTGLPRHDLSWYYFDTNSRDSMMQRLAYLEPSAGLREKWQYNNFMFMLQGIVTEKITGKSWEDNIRQKIFAPLGMTNSNLSVAEMEQSADKAIGYGVRNDSIIEPMPYHTFYAMAPAGAINSSVVDMAKWVSLWINNGQLNGTELIPASYIAQATSSQMAMPGGLPSKERPDIFLSTYGFGWFLNSYRGHYRVEHGGNIDGFSASTCFFPADSVGVIVLCNQSASQVNAVVRNLVIDRVLNLKYVDWESDLKRNADKGKADAKAAEKAKTPSASKRNPPTHPLKDYEGLYSNKGYGTFEVTVQNDSLFAILGPRLWWLRPYNYDAFTPFEKDENNRYDTTENSEAMQFLMSVSGDVESVLLHAEPAVKPINFTRSPKAKEISKNELQQYTGEYEIAGQTIKVYIKGDNSLFLFVPGQPEYELIPVEKNKFSLKSLSGFSVEFKLDNNNQASELISTQPNGTFTAKRKK